MFAHFLISLTILLSYDHGSRACGPGQGWGWRRSDYRRSTPLIYKQQEPSVSELSMSASGPSESRITMDDVDQLVINNNPDVLFKDDEGTGVDRIMSKRCRDRVNALAVLVMNNWPGVKLRVTDAWVSNPAMRPPGSLHFEGRAVDITTSDRDRKKYGLLARLAVNAGFDWVYYESHGHVHCSVKSDSASDRFTGCFPGTSRVYVEGRGRMSMSEVNLGDRVLVVEESSGLLKYDAIIAFLHRDPLAASRMIEIITETNKTLQLTPQHLIFTTSTSSETVATEESRPSPTRAVFADSLTVNSSSVFALSHNEMSRVQPEKVIRISKRFVHEGVYAPITGTGTIVVDDIAASCYALFANHRLAHLALAPFRFYRQFTNYWFEDILNSNESNTLGKIQSQKNTASVHWYAEYLYVMSKSIMGKSWWHETVF